MAPIQNRQLIFTAIPDPVLKENVHCKVLPSPLLPTVDPSAPSLPANALLLKHLYHSFDPYLRGRMRAPEKKSYSSAFELNTPIVSLAVAKVLASTSPAFQAGDLVYGGLPIGEYSQPEGEAALKQLRKIENPENLPLSYFVGALGMPGLTAYSSLMEIGKPEQGETILVSAASGAVGAMVCTLAKKLGLKVIASVGSEAKARYCTEDLGVDAVFNYKDLGGKSLSEVVGELAPQGIDIYYDNVGGEQLEAALTHMRDFGRIVACGSISQYNVAEGDRYGIRNTGLVVAKRLTWRGFIVGDPGMGPKWAAAHRENVTAWLKEGMKPLREHTTVGIENAAEGLAGIFRGENFGKAVLKVAED